MAENPRFVVLVTYTNKKTYQTFFLKRAAAESFAAKKRGERDVKTAEVRER